MALSSLYAFACYWYILCRPIRKIESNNACTCVPLTHDSRNISGSYRTKFIVYFPLLRPIDFFAQDTCRNNASHISVICNIPLKRVHYASTEFHCWFNERKKPNQSFAWISSVTFCVSNQCYNVTSPIKLASKLCKIF